MSDEQKPEEPQIDLGRPINMMQLRLATQSASNFAQGLAAESGVPEVALAYLEVGRNILMHFAGVEMTKKFIETNVLGSSNWSAHPVGATNLKKLDRLAKTGLVLPKGQR